MYDEIKVLVSESKIDRLLSNQEEIKKQLSKLLEKKRHSELNEYLNSFDVMKVMGWSRATLQRRVSDIHNPIPMFKDGNEWRISPSKFNAWRETVESIN